MCGHDLAEREMACADGYCPICLRAHLIRLEEGIKQELEDYCDCFKCKRLRKLLEGK